MCGGVTCDVGESVVLCVNCDVREGGISLVLKYSSGSCTSIARIVTIVYIWYVYTVQFNGGWVYFCV